MVIFFLRGKKIVNAFVQNGSVVIMKLAVGLLGGQKFIFLVNPMFCSSHGLMDHSDHILAKTATCI